MLNTFLRWLRNHLSLNETFIYYGTQDELVYAINHGDNRGRKNAANQYVFAPFISWGTMTGMFNSGIEVFLEHEPISSEAQLVKFYTKIRPEIWILVGMFSLMFIVFIISRQVIPGIPIVVICLPIFVWWFNLIYKVQEEALIHKVKKKLRLREYQP